MSTLPVLHGSAIDSKRRQRLLIQRLGLRAIVA